MDLNLFQAVAFVCAFMCFFCFGFCLPESIARFVEKKEGGFRLILMSISFLILGFGLSYFV